MYNIRVIPLTAIDIGNISFINVIENIDRVIEFMRNITIGNNSNIGLMIMRIVQWNTVELRVLT